MTASYRINPHHSEPGHLDEVVMDNANVHLEQMNDTSFMLIIENADQRIHMVIGSRGRARVDAWILEQYKP